MTPEQHKEAHLTEKFPFLHGHIRIPRARRLFVAVSAEKKEEVFRYLVQEEGFVILCVITGLDKGDGIGMEVLYHLATESGIVLTLAVPVDRQMPVVRTVTNYFPAADAYEREMTDLLGIRIEGLSEGHRYPLPYNWPVGQYPLRKDWKQESVTSLSTPVKEGV